MTYSVEPFEFCEHGYIVDETDIDACKECKLAAAMKMLRRVDEWCTLQISHPGCTPGPSELQLEIRRKFGAPKTAE